MNPYDPPQSLEDESAKVDVVKTEGNFRVFAAGVALVVGGTGVILFRHLGRSFVDAGKPSTFAFDWLLLTIPIGILLMLCRGIQRRRRHKR